MVRDLAVFTSTIAIGFFLAVAFYESLARRDVLVASSIRLVKRVTGSRMASGGVYLLTVVGLIPLLVALWAIVLEKSLVIVGTTDTLGVAESAVAIVAAARVLAYVREKTADDLAKLIPMALALLLLVGGVSQIEDNLAAVWAEPLQSGLTLEMIGFLVALEVGLRLANDSIRGLVNVVTKRRQIRSKKHRTEPRPSSSS